MTSAIRHHLIRSLVKIAACTSVNDISQVVADVCAGCCRRRLIGDRGTAVLVLVVLPDLACHIPLLAQVQTKCGSHQWIYITRSLRMQQHIHMY